MDVICDFRQFYNVDIPYPLSDDVDIGRLAVLWTGLPRESRTARRMNPDLEWNSESYLLSNIEYWAHFLAWAQTKDAKHKRNVPKPIDPPGKRIREQRHLKHSLENRKEVAQFLGIKDE